MATSILIVDDFATFRASARTLLEAEGFQIVGEAENGASAVRLARELEPEVVLLDVHLPDFDGFEVAERLQALESPPVVIRTSSRDDYRSLVASSPARAFLRKDELSGPALTSALSSS